MSFNRLSHKSVRLGRAESHMKIETSTPPAPLDIDAMFRDPRMFDSKQRFRENGFEVRQNNDHNIMVGSHPSAPAHLFKQYDRHVPLPTQLTNYAQRAQVAKEIRGIISEKHFRHLVVPQKWICALPRAFGDRKLLIVERLDLLKSNAALQRYRDIDEGQLRELCWILFKFRHPDAAPHNIIFAQSGQIAFIDTEHWERSNHQISCIVSVTPFQSTHAGRPISSSISGEEVMAFRTIL